MDPTAGPDATRTPGTRRPACPAPLRPGDVVAVTAPSSGVRDELRPRLDVAVESLRAKGFGVVVGNCLDGSGVVSAPAADRATELTGFLLDPAVRAVVPPWGGELAIELLPLLDLDALAATAPTWVVGFSDLSTLLLPLTVRSGWVTLHGQNLMDTPYEVPAPLLAWTDVVTADAGTTLRQGSSARHRLGRHDDWAADPAASRHVFDTAGSWRPLDAATTSVDVTGVLLGGCVETVGALAGTPFGDVPGFARAHAPDGLVLYLEASDAPAPTIARHLWQLRWCGWFDDVRAVLVGRTKAPAQEGFTQDDAARTVLGDLGVPVLLDVDCGHVPPHLSLLNGLPARVEWSPDGGSVTQTLPG